MNTIQAINNDIYQYAIEKITKINDISSVPNPNSYGNIISFEINNIHSHDVLEYMTQRNIEMRAGHMCAQGVLAAFGKTSINRISWGIGSTEEDIDFFVDILGECINDK